MDEDFRQAVNRIMREKVTSGITVYIDRMVAELKATISIPVDYQTGPRGGQVIIRSSPGEPPRKDFGTLTDSIEISSPINGDTSVEIDLYTTYKVAAYLQEGTKHMDARPWWPQQDELDNDTNRLVSDIADNF